jgi:hypothetical protein
MFLLFDYHHVCVNKNGKYIAFMLNYVIKIYPFFNIIDTIEHKLNTFTVFIHAHLMMVKETEICSVTAMVN